MRSFLCIVFRSLAHRFLQTGQLFGLFVHLVLQKEDRLLHLLHEDAQTGNAVVSSLRLPFYLLAAALLAEDVHLWAAFHVLVQLELLHGFAAVRALDQGLRTNVVVLEKVLPFNGRVALAASDGELGTLCLVL